MPVAAWCDECEANVWVTPAGQCPAGHAATGLRNHYSVPAPVPLEAKPAGRSVILKWAVGLMAVFLVLIAAASVVSVTHLVSAPNSTKRLAVETDAFIAREYPGYTVVQRRTFSDYLGVAGSGTEYFLERTGNPGFVLLVAVCKPSTVTQEAWDLGFVRSGDFLTTDAVFSQSMMEGSWVTETIVSAVASQYLLAKPASHAVITWTTKADRVVFLDIADDTRYDNQRGYSSPLFATKLGMAEVQGPLNDSRPLVTFTMSDIWGE